MYTARIAFQPPRATTIAKMITKPCQARIERRDGYQRRQFPLSWAYKGLNKKKPASRTIFNVNFTYDALFFLVIPKINVFVISQKHKFIEFLFLANALISKNYVSTFNDEHRIELYYKSSYNRSVVYRLSLL